MKLVAPPLIVDEKDGLMKKIDSKMTLWIKVRMATLC